MLTASLLNKKRNAQELSDDEIRFLVDGFCDGAVADYQMAAFAMAACLTGMSQRETATLTRAMLESGECLPRPSDDGMPVRPRIDKHSTGGLGDKVSLILAPMLAECGYDVPMISGRGLGITGGTLDKLESIPGFSVEYSIAESTEILKKTGAFIIGADKKIAPADKKLYALRDVTGTVESVALITASILSKKLAASLDALVMDVKVGHAAFMKTIDDATRLSESLIRVGQQAGLPTSVIISDMDQPLGSAVGNAIEVNESLDVLGGQGPPEVRELTVELCANLLTQVGGNVSRENATARLEQTLDDGSALERFHKMVHAQGGRLERDSRLEIAKSWPVVSTEDGYLSRFDCAGIGNAVVSMGGGRQKIGDVIDPQVGLHLHAKIGDRIEKGQEVMTAYFHNDSATDYVSVLSDTFELSAKPVAARPLILKRLN